jgi:DNA-binding CsgD family transcriptional regulator
MLGHDEDSQPFCRRDCPTIAAARRGRGVPAYDIRSRTRDGTDICINMSIIPAGGKDRSAPAAIHMFRDVTDHRRTETLAKDTVEAVRGFLEDGGSQPGRPGSAPAPRPALSVREVEVLRRLAEGDSTEEIAGHLSIAIATARNHIDRVMRKLGVHTRLQAVVRGRSLGFIGD